MKPFLLINLLCLSSNPHRGLEIMSSVVVGLFISFNLLFNKVFYALLSSYYWKLEILKRACIVLETLVVCLNHSCDDMPDLH